MIISPLVLYSYEFPLAPPNPFHAGMNALHKHRKYIRRLQGFNICLSFMRAALRDCWQWNFTISPITARHPRCHCGQVIRVGKTRQSFLAHRQSAIDSNPCPLPFRVSAAKPANSVAATPLSLSPTSPQHHMQRFSSEGDSRWATSLYSYLLRKPYGAAAFESINCVRDWDGRCCERAGVENTRSGIVAKGGPADPECWWESAAISFLALDSAARELKPIATGI